MGILGRWREGGGVYGGSGGEDGEGEIALFVCILRSRSVAGGSDQC